MYKTLFNPLAQNIDPASVTSASYLEDFFTRRDVPLAPGSDLDTLTKLFWFVNLNDASQTELIKTGLDRFARKMPETRAHSFIVSRANHEENKIHCLGTPTDTKTIEEIMRMIFEKGESTYVDTQYEFPSLTPNPFDRDFQRLGWLESSRGTFMFTDEQRFEVLKTALQIG